MTCVSRDENTQRHDCNGNSDPFRPAKQVLVSTGLIPCIHFPRIIQWRPLTAKRVGRWAHGSKCSTIERIRNRRGSKRTCSSETSWRLFNIPWRWSSHWVSCWQCALLWKEGTQGLGMHRSTSTAKIFRTCVKWISVGDVWNSAMTRISPPACCSGSQQASIIQACTRTYEAIVVEDSQAQRLITRMLWWKIYGIVTEVPKCTSQLGCILLTCLRVYGILYCTVPGHASSWSLVQTAVICKTTYWGSIPSGTSLRFL